MKLKIAGLLALCICISTFAGINSVSATNSATFSNVDFKNGESLTFPSMGALSVKGIQFSDNVGMRVSWDDYSCSNESYLVKVSIDYEDLFNESNTLDYYLYVDNETGTASDYWYIPYMNLNKDNAVTIQIVHDDGPLA